MKDPEFVGFWACKGCGARVWARASLQPLLRPPCPSCMTGEMVPDRRRQQRMVRTDRRKPMLQV